MVVTLLYSGYFLGVLPTQKGISWESHLYGAFVGILVAYWFKDNREQDEYRKEASWANEKAGETSYFLPRDAFELTREQRQQRKDNSNSFDLWSSDSTLQ